MNLKLIALASVAMIGLTAIAMPDQAEARWRHGGCPGAIIGGLALGAATTSRPYYRSGGPHYAYGYGPYYYGYSQQPYPYNILSYRNWSLY